TRVLDYLWAGLPMVATTGEATSDLVAAYEVGCVVGYGAVDEVAAALLHLLAEPRGARAANFARARAGLTWEKAAAPLMDFCRSPRRAPDRTGDWQTPEATAQALQTARLAHWEQVAAQAQAEVERLRALVDGYERGRFIRVMRWLNTAKRRVWSRP
ncbi:MAG TPA: hypothetical protein VNK95_11080, partial [Caldilineaceae bacterium]|nr:hypothetical protein [Caldilineaceae bacterium]